jgi:hypothetical protein
MSAKNMHRPLAVLLALALSLGLVMHSVPGSKSIAKAGDMTASMSMDMPTDVSMDMPADMPATGGCNGCAGDEKGLMPTACSAFCGSVASLPLVPVVFKTVPVATLWPAAETRGTGHTRPPDPYPPKPVVLS